MKPNSFEGEIKTMIDTVEEVSKFLLILQAHIHLITKKFA
jgi:hypothetical protein